MAQRFNGNMRGERFLGNTEKLEVHDLNHEKVNCQVDEIMKAGNDKSFTTLYEAHLADYDNCYWCIGNSKR